MSAIGEERRRHKAPVQYGADRPDDPDHEFVMLSPAEKSRRRRLCLAVGLGSTPRVRLMPIRAASPITQSDRLDGARTGSTEPPTTSELKNSELASAMPGAL